MPFPYDKYPWINYQELNLAYFIEHFQEIFQQWDQLYHDLLSWQASTEEDLEAWKTAVEGGLESWKTGVEAGLETWKTETQADITGWETATLAALDAWKTATTAVFEEIRTAAAASATAAAGSASSAQTALTGAQAAQAAAEAAAAGIAASMDQIAQNQDNIAQLQRSTDARINLGYQNFTSDDFELGGWSAAGNKTTESRIIRVKNPIRISAGDSLIYNTGSLYVSWFALDGEGTRIVRVPDSDNYWQRYNDDRKYTFTQDCTLYFTFRNANNYGASTDITPEDYDGDMAIDNTLAGRNSARISEIEQDLSDLAAYDSAFKLYVDNRFENGYSAFTSENFEPGGWNYSGEKINQSRIIRIKEPVSIKAGDYLIYNTGSLYVSWFALDGEGTRIVRVPDSDNYWQRYNDDRKYTFTQDCTLYFTFRNANNYGASTDITPEDYDGDMRVYDTLASQNAARISEAEEDIADLTAGMALRPTSETILKQSFNAAYHAGATDFDAKCSEYTALLYGEANGNVTDPAIAPADFETFLFFTDPHLLFYTGWQTQLPEFISIIQKYYNSTPTSFCACGGDWLGNDDLPSSALFKLGYVDGIMRSMFENCRMLVGNHDYNYQGKLTPDAARGSTRLSVQSLADLWYRENHGKTYYKFLGDHTQFYCFDTGTEGQSVVEYGNYGYEQAEWFAQSLLAESAEHIAILAHILYYNSELTVLQPLTQMVLNIALAYNTRSTTTVRGVSYDYSNAGGKIEFLLAGHSHRDGVFTVNGIPCIITLDVRHDLALGPSFDLVMADYDNSTLHMIRVGSGSNRIVSL